MSIQSQSSIAFPLYESVPLSRLNTDAADVSERMQQSPVQVMKSSKTFGVLVSREHWNLIANEMTVIEDLREVIELLNLEIDRLKEGRPEGEPWDMDELERIAGRVPA